MKKESKVNQAKYVELNLFPEEKEEHQKKSISSENMESDTSPDKEYDLTDLFERLSKSTFRSRFHLSKKDKEYIAEKGLATIRKHAEDFVAKRLAPAVIPNDGKQTPMRGHPVFIAQHATGCCCRGCFFNIISPLMSCLVAILGFVPNPQPKENKASLAEESDIH